jgi:hypothetical protein
MNCDRGRRARGAARVKVAGITFGTRRSLHDPGFHRRTCLARGRGVLLADHSQEPYCRSPTTETRESGRTFQGRGNSDSQRRLRPGPRTRRSKVLGEKRPAATAERLLGSAMLVQLHEALGSAHGRQAFGLRRPDGHALPDDESQGQARSASTGFGATHLTSTGRRFCPRGHPTRRAAPANRALA